MTFSTKKNVDKTIRQGGPGTPHYPENIAGKFKPCTKGFSIDTSLQSLYNLNKNELRFQEISLDSLNSKNGDKHHNFQSCLQGNISR